MMSLSVAVPTAALVTGSLVACSNGYGVPPTASISADGSTSKTSVAPVELRSSEILAKIHLATGLGQSESVTPGIYANAGKTIFGYRGYDQSNGPPVCSIPVIDFRGIAVDRQGDLLVPDQSSTITVFAGPGLCGPTLGTITDPYGGPENVASLNAKSGQIVVATYKQTGVSVCTLSGGCTAELTVAGARELLGVALAPNGDCWASGAERISSHKIIPALAYFAHCRGRGVFANGFQPSGTLAAGLDIDDNGNLVVGVGGDHPPGLAEYIYSGCNPTCSLVGGPFRVNGIYGHLDASSKKFVTEGGKTAGVSVYSYSTSGIKYLYSISNGLQSYGVWSAAFSPASKE
jgi:hypothetical protein